MKKLILTAALGLGLATGAAQAQESPLSGLDGTLNAVNILVAAGTADPALAPNLLSNVGAGVGIIALQSLGDPTSLPQLSPLDLSSLDSVFSDTIMIQNYPGGAALLPVLGIVSPLLGGIIGTGN